MSAMDAGLRRITVGETDAGLEALAIFICRGGLLPEADSWKRYRHAAWRRMVALQDEGMPPLPLLPNQPHPVEPAADRQPPSGPREPGHHL